MKIDKFKVSADKKINLKDFDPDYTGDFHKKEEAKEVLSENIMKLSKLQDILYASNTYALLITLQAIDAAGKDGMIKHIMSGVNPQGCQVYSFKSPSAEELDHDYMWRCMKLLPEKGKIGIFNRSYYEEVLVVKVHKELLEKQNIPKEKINGKLWEERYEDINNIEKYFHRNRIVNLKFFLNISKEEQKLRFLKRINTPEKNWKFSLSDLKERNFWDDYFKAFEDMLNNSSTKHSPWYIVPANNKWYSRAVVSEIVVSTLESLNLKYPEVSEEHRKDLLEAKRILESEK